jgi:hypothetical protein
VKNYTGWLVVLAAGLASATETSAHFKLLTPAPWVTTNDLGDPQKVGPCGGDPKGQNEPLLSPQVPLLADGLFQHYPKPGEPASARPKTPMAPWETEIEIPNINCAKCTLQVIQFMADHVYNQPGGYAYHQCADLEIAADASKPIDTRWPAATTSK